MSDLVIRRAVAGDTTVLVAFNQALAWETEGQRLDPAVLEAGVTGLLRQPQYGFYLVAEAAGTVVAALLITFEWSDWRNGPLWWLQSVYVQPAWRRRGVYRRLYTTVEALARAEGTVRGLRLYVERENHIAQQTYQALGMREAPYRLFERLWP